MSSIGASRISGVDLDIIEKLLLVIFIGLLTSRLLPGVIETRALSSAILLASEGVIVFFVLIRRRTSEITPRGLDWTFAMGGTLVPLLAVAPQGQAVMPMLACGLVMIVGVLTQWSAKLTLRRSFGVVAANRGVKVGGPYRFVRHPMYAGYMLTHIGFVLSGPVLWNIVVFSLGAMLATRRILAEERVLGNDEAYRAMMLKVRYRLIPLIY